MLERKLFGVAVKWLLVAVLAIGIIGWVVSCQIGGSSQKARQGKADTATAEAHSEAASAAVETVLEQAEEEVELQELVTKAAKEIDNAKSPADARRAALAATCELRIYRDDPQCAVFRTNP